VKVARKLGLSEEETEDIEQAALLHDVGKMGISDAVLGKPGPLDAGEWEEIKEHPKVGERIVASIESLTHLAPIVRAEHEWWNGQGCPDGLSGEEIPLASRIVLACDAFHAMTSDRPYRKAMRPEDAVRELEKEAGEQFDPQVIRSLVEVLTSQRLAPPGGSGPT
jgi:HD-GYP domain-containing protein (c-di-GMP phosphodiesterase class II)